MPGPGIDNTSLTVGYRLNPQPLAALVQTLNIIQLKTAIKYTSLRPIEPEQQEKSPAIDSGNPVCFFAHWGLGAEVDIDTAIIILLERGHA